jgi:hypothetical protein
LNRSARVWVFVLVLAGLFVILLLAAPIAQPPEYHGFADSRAVLGIANFWNVASNAAFMVVGIAGLARLRRGRWQEATGWLILFTGTAFVAAGSALYHLAPSDQTLVWDRVPIGVAFMGLLSALVADYISPRAGRVLILPAIAVALGAIAWWRVTGDLSAWVWVQAAPLLAVVLVLALFPASRRDGAWLLGALGCYVAAKLFEVADQAFYELAAGVVSGHSMKHLLAAAGVACLVALLRGRGMP